MMMNTEHDSPFSHVLRMQGTMARSRWTSTAATSTSSARYVSVSVSVSVLLLLLLLSLSFQTVRSAEEWKPTLNDKSVSELFEPSDVIAVNGPSHFPKPTRKIDDNATVIIEPTFGKHRPDADAIMAYAEGYQLSYYMMFMETLTATGFTGDVVLAIADDSYVREDVVDYLRTYADRDDPNKPSVVVYQLPLDCEGSSDGKRTVTKHGDTNIFQMCRLSHVYGWKDEQGQVTGTAHDPREGRVVATLRYEWYWIWSLSYSSHSWLMLLDARDSFFQLNPFANVPRETDLNRKDGVLYLFGENPDATRLGKSTKNLKWLRNAYGPATIEALKDKPTICSGSTMGEQIAVETYLRAMVNEHDECDIRMTGSDQGFHNYLHYSGKLHNAEPIRRIVVWEQGRGAINNLGALRTKTLSQWGMYNEETHEVFQWDGTLSPVVHQWDRDKALHSYMWGKRHRQWSADWAKQKEKKQKAIA
jgi:hypothetical protein